MATPGQGHIERRPATILTAGIRRREFIALVDAHPDVIVAVTPRDGVIIFGDRSASSTLNDPGPDLAYCNPRPSTDENGTANTSPSSSLTCRIQVRQYSGLEPAINV